MESITIKTIGTNTISVGGELYVLFTKASDNGLPIFSYKVTDIMGECTNTPKAFHVKLQNTSGYCIELLSVTIHLNGSNVNHDFNEYFHNKIHVYTNISQAYLVYKQYLEDTVKRLKYRNASEYATAFYKELTLLNEHISIDKLKHPEFYY
jgi:hypothetical protein